MFLLKGSLQAKITRNDSLARLLNSRPQKLSAGDQSVIPHRSEAEKAEIRRKIGNHLNKFVYSNTVDFIDWLYFGTFVYETYRLCFLYIGTTE